MEYPNTPYLPYATHQPWSPWEPSRSMMPFGDGWGGSQRPGAPGWGGFAPGGYGRAFGGGFGCFPRGWTDDQGARDQNFTVSISGAELLNALAWIPATLRDAANDIESSDATRRLQAEGAVRGAFGFIKGTLSAFGVSASIDAGVERRGISASISYSRSALLSTADAIERFMAESHSRGLSGSCSVNFSRGFMPIVRGLSVSVGVSF